MRKLWPILVVCAFFGAGYDTEYVGEKWCHETGMNYAQHPLECPIKYLANDPEHNGIIYLAPDGTVRWKIWKKGEKPKGLEKVK